jgi:hypothetical protein
MLARTEPAPAWFPDWRDRAVAIIASGPSTTKQDVAALRGRLPVIAIKDNVDLAPWADVVYGCDAAWWRQRTGLARYPGLKISATRRGIADAYRDIEIVKVEPATDQILFEPAGIIGSGGNSGFQALNLAVQFGADRILLIGFDMDDRSGTHWYGRNQGTGRSNPGELNFRRWRAAFVRSAPLLKEASVSVVNASPISKLACFPRAGVAATLAAFGL